MLADGIRLMAVGMITVFGFLTVLVAVMAAQAAFFSAFLAALPFFFFLLNDHHHIFWMYVIINSRAHFFQFDFI